MAWRSEREPLRMQMLPHNKQVKQQIEQCTCINKPVNTEILIQKYNVNLSSKGNNVTVEKKKKKKSKA